MFPIVAIASALLGFIISMKRRDSYSPPSRSIEGSPKIEIVPGNAIQVLTNDQLFDFANEKHVNDGEYLYLLLIQRELTKNQNLISKSWVLGNTLVEAAGSNDLEKCILSAKVASPLTMTTLVINTIDGDILYQWHSPAYPNPNPNPNLRVS